MLFREYTEIPIHIRNLAQLSSDRYSKYQFNFQIHTLIQCCFATYESEGNGRQLHVYVHVCPHGHSHLFSNLSYTYTETNPKTKVDVHQFLYSIILSLIKNSMLKKIVLGI